MQRSPELETLTRRILTAFGQSDAEALRALFDRRDDVVAIGTDPAEWWAGYDTATRIFITQSEEMSGATLIPANPTAFEEGDVGWVADQPVLRLPDGTEAPLRLTAVYRKTEDGWKAVQWHASFGIPNEEGFGEKLTIE